MTQCSLITKSSLDQKQIKKKVTKGTKNEVQETQTTKKRELFTFKSSKNRTKLGHIRFDHIYVSERNVV